MVLFDQIFPGSGALTPIAGSLITQAYSRSEEYAADRHGVDILTGAGVSRRHDDEHAEMAHADRRRGRRGLLCDASGHE
jgi:hypothetical protein